MSEIFTEIDTEYQQEAKLTDDKVDRIIQQWMAKFNSSQMKVPKDTKEFLVYLLKNMDQQGVLLQSIKAISINSGIKEYNVQKILVNLEFSKVIYKKYGIVGCHNINELNEIE